MRDHLERLRERRDEEAFRAGVIMASAGGFWLLLAIAIVGSVLERGP